MAAETLTTLQINIQHESSKAVTGIDNLTNALKRLKATASGGMGMNKVIAELRHLNEQIEKMDKEALKNLANIASASAAKMKSAMASASKAAESATTTTSTGDMSVGEGESVSAAKEAAASTKEAAESTQTWKNALDQVNSKYSLLKYSMAQAKKGYDSATSEKEALKYRKQMISYSSQLETIEKQIKDNKEKEVDAVRKRVQAQLDSASSASEEAKNASKAADAEDKFARATEKASSAAKNATSATKESSKAASTFAQKMSSIGAAIKRIVFYRILRSALQGITSALKEGITNLYQWDKAVGNTGAASALDTWATEVQYLKNAIGGLLMQLIIDAMPVIEQIIDGAVKIINVIQQVIAALSGRDHWYKANKSAATFADTAQDASDSVKSLNEQLMGFDEINNITTDTSGGSGSSSSAIDYSDMFDYVELDPWAQKFKSFVDEVKGYVKDKLDPFIEKVKGWFDDIKEKLSKLDWSKFNDGIKRAKDLWYRLKKVVGLVWDVLCDIFNWLTDGGDGQMALDFFAGIWDAAWTGAEGAVQLIQGALEVIQGILEGDMQKAAIGVIDIAAGVAKGFLALVETTILLAWQPIELFFDKIIDKAEEVLDESIREFGEQLHLTDAEIDAALDKANTGFENVRTSVHNVNGDIASTFSSLYDKIDEAAAKAKASINSTGAYFQDIGMDAGRQFASKFMTQAKLSLKNVEIPINARIAYVNGKAVSVNTSYQIPYANGGFTDNLEQGTMFVAGEVPGQAEMIGNINGRSGVVSGTEISGIGDAVYSTGNTTASLLSTLIQVVAEKDLTIAPSSRLGAVVKQSQRLYSGVTG